MVTITISFIDCAFGPRLPDCSKLSINRKNDNDVINFRHDFILKYFWRDFVSVINFSYWAKFHVSIITGSGVITFFCYKGWPEIGNTPVWVLPNIWRMRRVRDTIFGTSVCNKMLMNAAKCQVYSFYRFWVIKRKPTRGGEGGGNSLPPTQIRVKKTINNQ